MSLLQLRPTFSESWYRVVGLKPRLRPTAQVSRQYYRGERWYVVRDPAGNQYHRLSDAAYRFVGLLDGTRTVGEAWEQVGGQLDDFAPTQPEVIQILSQLYAANLIETDIPPDATVLLRRQKKQAQRKFQGRLMNVLFPRIPLWDPDRFVCRWMPAVRPFLSGFGAILWLLVVGAAVAILVPRFDDLRAAAGNAIAPGNWIFLWATFVLTKFIHELGHAFACRRFGGEVHEMGIMFLVLIPTPYVDASSAWGFPNKWARIFVGAGGMVIELFIAAIMAFVWAATTPGVPVLGLPVNELAYNAMLIASVTTVLFNANPLLRYDGYYMLSDYLEIPNLQRKASEYTLGLVKRHVYRVKSLHPLPPPAQRVQLFAYAVLSTAYRIFISIAIILMVLYQLPEPLKLLGLVMAAGAVVTFFVMPIGKLLKYLAIDPELHRKRGRAWAFCTAVAAAILILIGLVRFPVTVLAEGAVEPSARRALFVQSPGFVEQVAARDGERVEKDQVLLVCRDNELAARIAELEAQRGGLRQRLRLAELVDAAERRLIEVRLGAVDRALADLYRQRDELTLRAPIAGQLVAPRLHYLPGSYLERGKMVAEIAVLDRLDVYAAVSQRDAQLLDAAGDARTEVRLAGALARVLTPAGAPSLVRGAQQQLRHPALGMAGGGEIAVDPSDPSGQTPQQRHFELRVPLDNPNGLFVPGQRAYVLVTLDRKPLLWQWTRKFLQLIQSQKFQQQSQQGGFFGP